MKKCQVLADYIFTGYFLSVSRLSSFCWLLSLPRLLLWFVWVGEKDSIFMFTSKSCLGSEPHFFLVYWIIFIAGSQHGRSHPWQGHAEETWQARRIRTHGTPWTPKSLCVLFAILCLSPTLRTLTGGYPQPPFSGENQLRVLVDKSPGHERSISIQTPLLAFYLACQVYPDSCNYTYACSQHPNHDTGSLSILKM